MPRKFRSCGGHTGTSPARQPIGSEKSAAAAGAAQGSPPTQDCESRAQQRATASPPSVPNRSTGAASNVVDRLPPVDAANAKDKTATSGNMRRLTSPDESEAQLGLIVRLIIADLRPISLVEEPAFMNMLRGFAGDAQLSMPCPRTVANRVAARAAVAKAGLVQELRGEALTLTSECWTSVSQVPMLGISAHWLTKDFDMRSACLGVVELCASNTNER